MRKKVFLSLIAMASILLTIALLTMQKEHEQSLLLYNIEALAQNEAGGMTLDCWNTITSHGNAAGSPNQMHKTYCLGCEAKLCHEWSGASTCKK